MRNMLNRNVDDCSCLQNCVSFYAVVLWASAIGLASFALWNLLDPARCYLLNLVDFSEDDPLLRFGTYAILFTAFFTLFTGFVGHFGANKMERCLLSSFSGFLLLLIILYAGLISTTVTFHRKFQSSYRMSIYLANLTHNHYNRDDWVTPLIDYIQYYQQCCGGLGPSDYINSFWFVTNTERGTRSYVPPSCCRQTQIARAWAPQPIDPMCGLYTPNSRAFNDSINTDGCGAPMKDFLDSITQTFLLVIGAAIIIDGFGLILAVLLLHRILTRYKNLRVSNTQEVYE